MGYNITGYATNVSIQNKEDLETLCGVQLSDLESEAPAYEEATASFREDGQFYIYANDKGSLIFPNFGHLAQNIPSSGEFIQFIVSDVSDTHYFEMYNNGELTRKLILTDGEVAEEYGEGFIEGGDELFEKVWDYIQEAIGVSEADVMELPFRAYSIV